jgi:hypothetical protein
VSYAPRRMRSSDRVRRPVGEVPVPFLQNNLVLVDINKNFAGLTLQVLLQVPD